MFPLGAIVGLAGQAVSGALSTINNRKMQQSADAEAARQKAYYDAKANENPLKRTVEHLEDTSEAHRGPTQATYETNENPHIENNLRIQRAVTRAVVVLAQEMNHQWRTHQGDAHPDPVTPVLLPQHKRGKLYKQEECRRVSPDKKKVLARRYPVAINLATHSADDIEFCSSHTYLLLMLQI